MVKKYKQRAGDITQAQINAVLGASRAKADVYAHNVQNAKKASYGADFEKLYMGMVKKHDDAYYAKKTRDEASAFKKQYNVTHNLGLGAPDPVAPDTGGGFSVLGHKVHLPSINFHKVLDFISRPYEATANAALKNEQAYYRAKDADTHNDGSIKDWFQHEAKGFRAGLTGWSSGITGKEHASFMDVVADSDDRRHARARGAKSTDAVPGEGHTGKLKKIALGLTGDILGDPTTYLGVGAVGHAVGIGGKALKGSDVVSHLNEVSKVRQLVAKEAPHISTKELDALTGIKHLPVGLMTKKQVASLSPEVMDLFKGIKTVRKGMTAKELKLSKKSGHFSTKIKYNGEVLKADEVLNRLPHEVWGLANSSARARAVTELNVAGKGMRSAREIYNAAPAGTMTAHRARQLAAADAARFQKEVGAKATADLIKSGAGTTAKEFEEKLLAQTIRNTAPDVRKIAHVTIMGKSGIPLPGVLPVLKVPFRAVGSIPHVAQSVELFHKAFNANHGIAPIFSALRNRAAGQGTQVIKAEATELKSIFGKMTKADRKSLLVAYENGSIAGSMVKGGFSFAQNGTVHNAAKYLDDNVKNIEASLNMTKISAKEIERWLPKNLRYHINDQFPKDMATGKNAHTASPAWFQDFFRTSIKNGSIKDPAEALFQFKSAIAQAVAKRELWASAAQSFGVPKVHNLAHVTTGVRYVSSNTARSLSVKGWKEVDMPGLKGYLFEPEVAETLQRMDKVFGDATSTGEYIKHLDKITQIFKGIVTRYNPSFQGRTLMGEVLLGQLGGMHAETTVQSYAQAARVLRGRSREFLDTPATPLAKSGRVTGADRRGIEAANMLTLGPEKAVRAADRLGTGQGAKIIMRRYGGLTSDQLWHRYTSSGLKSGYASVDLVRGVEHPVSKRIAKFSDKTQQLTESVEDIGRLAHFIDSIKHSKARTLEQAVDEATDTVMKYHLDYTAVTHFEKSVMARAMPFYKWLRLSTPMMVDVLLHQPGRALTFPKAMNTLPVGFGGSTVTSQQQRGISDPDAVVPSFLRDHSAVFAGHAFGNNQYFDPTAIFPLAGSAEIGGGGGKKALSMINPIFKTPAEWGFDKTTFGGKPSDDWSKWLSGQTPQTSLVHNVHQGPESDPDYEAKQRLLSFLFNPGVQPNTPQRQTSETNRPKAIMLEQAKKANKKKKKQEAWDALQQQRG